MLVWLKALHVIAVISWMAGMLYIWRLYVYHAMEQEQVVMDRLAIMERRLMNYITTPAMIVSLASGGAMFWMNHAYYLSQPWMHLKLTLLFLLFGSHGMASAHRKKLLVNPRVKPPTFYRVMNEVPTLLMVGIVIAVIVRPWAR
ncbi:MAG: CopD family protein [Candidatus Sericytochromatia bacterium]|nr:CopD family protein [Candidatus Sericytochromatia bacterium]